MVVDSGKRCSLKLKAMGSTCNMSMSWRSLSLCHGLSWLLPEFAELERSVARPKKKLLKKLLLFFNFLVFNLLSEI